MDPREEFVHALENLLSKACAFQAPNGPLFYDAISIAGALGLCPVCAIAQIHNEVRLVETDTKVGQSLPVMVVDNNGVYAMILRCDAPETRRLVELYNSAEHGKELWQQIAGDVNE